MKHRRSRSFASLSPSAFKDLVFASAVDAFRNRRYGAAFRLFHLAELQREKLDLAAWTERYAKDGAWERAAFRNRPDEELASMPFAQAFLAAVAGGP